MLNSHCLTSRPKDAFWQVPGLISCAGVTRSPGVWVSHVTHFEGTMRCMYVNKMPRLSTSAQIGIYLEPSVC